MIISGSLSAKPVKQKYTLTIQAADNGDPQLKSEVKIILKIPENRAPVIDNKELMFEVKEATGVGSFVGKILASDPDQSYGKLTYKIINANDGTSHSVSSFCSSSHTNNKFLSGVKKCYQIFHTVRQDLLYVVTMTALRLFM